MSSAAVERFWEALSNRDLSATSSPVADGRATAHRAIRDELGLKRQMGAIPAA